MLRLAFPTCGGEVGFFSADVDASRIGLSLASIKDVLGVGKLRNEMSSVTNGFGHSGFQELTRWSCCCIWPRAFASSRNNLVAVPADPLVDCLSYCHCFRDVSSPTEVN